MLEVAAISHTGLVRRRNEDAWQVRGLDHHPPEGVPLVASLGAPLLVAVADGLGGHPAGHVASQIAVRAALAAGPVSPADLADAVSAANASVYAAMRDDAELSRMGTTLTLALISRDSVDLAYVGDSPAFVMGAGRLIQITEDNAGPAGRLPGVPRPAINESVGGRESFTEIVPTIKSVELLEGDTVLIATDGLSNFVEPATIRTCLEVGQLGAVAQELVAAAMVAGAPDNLTLVVARVA